MCVVSHIYSHPQGPLSSGAIAGVVLGGLVFLIVLAVIAVCVCVLVYGYRHPTSKIGLFMIEVCLYDVCVCTEQYVKSVRFANRHATSLVEISTLLVLLGLSSCRLLCVWLWLYESIFCTLQHRPKAKSLNEKSSYNVESGKTAIDEKE